MPKIEEAGCYGCDHSDWDADGCTCGRTGLHVGNPSAVCPDFERTTICDDTVELHKVSSRPKSEQYVCISCGEFCYYPHCKKGIQYRFCPNCGKKVRGYA